MNDAEWARLRVGLIKDNLSSDIHTYKHILNKKNLKRNTK